MDESHFDHKQTKKLRGHSKKGELAEYIQHMIMILTNNPKISHFTTKFLMKEIIQRE